VRITAFCDGVTRVRVAPQGAFPKDSSWAVIRAGHTFAYQKGEFLRMNYSCPVSADSITVTNCAANHAFQPWRNTAEVTIFWRGC
jgi:hypothetical protein